MSRPPNLHVAPSPSTSAEPATVRRLEMTTLAAAIATGCAFADGLKQRGRALLVVPDEVLAGRTQGADLGTLFGDLMLYSCPAGAPEDAAPRYRMAANTLAWAFGVLTALLVPRYLPCRAMVILAADERSRAWWLAGAEFLWTRDRPPIVVETTLTAAGVAIQKLERLRPAEKEKLPALVLVDGSGLPAPRWSALVELFGAQSAGSPADTYLLALAPRRHVEAYGLLKVFGYHAAVIGQTAEDDSVWIAINGKGGYLLRSDALRSFSARGSEKITLK